MGGELFNLAQLSMAELIELAESVDEEGRDHILRGVEMNRQASRVGIRRRLGLGVGAALTSLVERGELAEDLMVPAKAHTAGAADARTCGADVEVMSSSGSGNQGILADAPRHVFENIGELARSMGAADRAIVQIMERKEIARRQG